MTWGAAETTWPFHSSSSTRAGERGGETRREERKRKRERRRETRHREGELREFLFRRVFPHVLDSALSYKVVSPNSFGRHAEFAWLLLAFVYPSIRIVIHVFFRTAIVKCQGYLGINTGKFMTLCVCVCVVVCMVCACACACVHLQAS